MRNAFVATCAAGLLVATCAAGLLLTSRTGKSQDSPAASPDYYTTKVQPIFQKNCYKCHSGAIHSGGLMLDTPAGILKGGDNGAVVVPGDPAKSILLILIRQQDTIDDLPFMPPDPNPKLSDDDIGTVEQWIKGGAKMPAAPGQ
jgi:cytochrome c